MTTTGDELPVPSRFGAYRLEERLGEGATGVVYRALDDRDGSVVALKVIRRALLGDPVYVARLAREGEIAQAVEHRNLVPVVAVGEVDGRPFLASRYLAGGSLQGRIQEAGRCELRETLRIAAHLAGGLDALAAQGLVHRDVKPANVMITTDGIAALTDFGLARGSMHATVTRPGAALGTIEYMAPELVRGERATPRSDIYALGCVVVACLLGRSPFLATSLFQVAHGHLSLQPPDLAVLCPGVPTALARAIDVALEKDPADRPRTATAYANLLRLSS